MLFDGIVPLAMKRIRVMTESFHFGVRHLDPFGVVIHIQGGTHLESGASGCGFNQVDNHLMANKWLPALIQADRAE